MRYIELELPYYEPTDRLERLRQRRNATGLLREMVSGTGGTGQGGRVSERLVDRRFRE